MRHKRALLTIIICAVILSLSALGSIWGHSLAQGTVPTEPPTEPTGSDPSDPQATSIPTSGSKPGNPSQGNNKKPAPSNPADNLNVVKKKITGSGGDLYFQNGNTAWGGANFGLCLNFPKAIIRLYQVPVESLKNRDQLNYHRQAMLVQFIARNRIFSSTCSYQVSFDLTRNERFIYNNYKNQDRIGIYWYDKKERTWEACSDVSFDDKQGLYGRMTCQTNNTGYFALGWPNPDKK